MTQKNKKEQKTAMRITKKTINVLNNQKSNLLKKMVCETYQNYCIIERTLNKLNKYKVINRTLDEYNYIKEEKMYLDAARYAIAEVYEDFCLVKKGKGINVGHFIHQMDKNCDYIGAMIDDHEQQLNMIKNYYKSKSMENAHQSSKSNVEKFVAEYAQISTLLNRIIYIYPKIWEDTWAIMDMLEDYPSGYEKQYMNIPYNII